MEFTYTLFLATTIFKRPFDNQMDWFFIYGLRSNGTFKGRRRENMSNNYWALGRYYPWECFSKRFILTKRLFTWSMNSISKLQRDQMRLQWTIVLGDNLKELNDCIQILLFQLNKGLKTFLETIRREVHCLFWTSLILSFIESQNITVQSSLNNMRRS